MITRTAIFALSLAFGAPALAAPAANDAAITVRIDDLNLASANDREALDARVKTAAQRLCRSRQPGTTELALRTQCIENAIASARAPTERAIAEAGRDARLAALSVKAAR